MAEARFEAFAPAAISNFFSIHDDGLSASPPDYAHVGATGGGYMLASGVRSRAREIPRQDARVMVVVNGDPRYEARTTTKAVELLIDSAGYSGGTIELVQTVEVPIGYGFGASAASALSGVLAVASLLEVTQSRAAIAYHAHVADIVCRTGLGTVSAIYNDGAAGVITTAGGPGVAEVHRVRVPKGLRIVTASLAPYGKGTLLSAKEKVNRLGDAALETASELTIESLMRAGEAFTEGLRVESPSIRRLAELARKNGAVGTGQNMVGEALHCLVYEEDVPSVARRLREDPLSPQVGVYEFGSSPHLRG